MSINSAFPAVYLVNGKLMEGGEITFLQKEVVYITVLPLEAILLPYTVKLVGALVKCNNDLAKCYSLDESRFYLKLSPRYNYVYSVSASTLKLPPKDLVEKFFSLVLEKKTAEARDCLSRELQESIDNASLASFFEGFVDIIPDDPSRGLYYLTDTQGKGTLFSFIVKNNLIDNIIEL